MVEGLSFLLEDTNTSATPDGLVMVRDDPVFRVGLRLYVTELHREYGSAAFQGVGKHQGRHPPS